MPTSGIIRIPCADAAEGVVQLPGTPLLFEGADRLFGLRAGVLPRSPSLRRRRRKAMDDAPTNRTGEKRRTPTEGLTISSDASKDLTEDEESLLDRHRRFSRGVNGPSFG